MRAKRLVTNPVLVAAVLIVVAAGGGSANAEVLYSHTFDGPASTITAVGADVANTGVILGADHGTSTANWGLSGGTFNQDGTITARGVGFLAFTPQDGYIYTFTMAATSTGSPWASGGFWEANGANTFQRGAVWALTRPNYRSAVRQSAYFEDLDNNVGTSSDTTDPSTIVIVLDTTEGAGSWDVEWFVEGSSFATATDIVLNDPIAGVGVGAGDTGTLTIDISSFSLEVAKPSPPAAGPTVVIR